MLMDLNLYRSVFETKFLEQTHQYYQNEGDRLVNEMNMSKYLEHVSDRIHQESVVRLKQYFDKSTKAALTAIVDECLLSIRVDTILNKCKKKNIVIKIIMMTYYPWIKLVYLMFIYIYCILGFDYFMDNNRIDDVSLLYRLLTKVDKLDTCVKYFINYVKVSNIYMIKFIFISFLYEILLLLILILIIYRLKVLQLSEIIQE